MFWKCHYVQKVWKTIWDLSIFTAENIDTEICTIRLCTYNKETQIYTFISAIATANISTCKYADKHLTNLKTGTKLIITEKLKD